VLLVVVLLPIWLLCAGLTLRQGLRGGPAYFPVPVRSAEGDDTYPTVAGRYAELGDRLPELTAGTPILRVGDADVRGARAVDVYAQAAAAGPDSRGGYPVEIGRGGAAVRVDLPRVENPRMWRWDLVFSCALVGIALLLLLRAPRWHLRRRFFAASVAIGIVIIDADGGSVRQTLFAYGLASIFVPLGLGLTLSNAVLWDRLQHRAPTWLRAVGWSLAALLGAVYFVQFWLPYPIPFSSLQLIGHGLLIACLLFLVAVMSGVYRRAPALERRRARIGILGLYLATVPFAAALALEAANAPPQLWRVTLQVSNVAQLALPLALLFGIVWYGAFDVDRVISSTSSYTLLVVAFVALWAGFENSLASWVTGALAIPSRLADVGLAAALAVVLLPSHGWLRKRLDGVFFPSHVQLERGIEALMDEVEDCGRDEDLARRVGLRLEALFQPDRLAVYLRRGAAFEPIAARPDGVAAPFPATGALVAALEERSTPLVARLGRAARRPFDEAALETLAASLALPLRGPHGLVAVVCCGRKRSGDIYTPTDVALLTAVCARAAQQLERIALPPRQGSETQRSASWSP
jgi:hypothetical protein